MEPTHQASNGDRAVQARGRRKRRATQVGSLLAIAGLVLSACGSGSSSAGSSSHTASKVVKIGSFMPKTGPNAGAFEIEAGSLAFFDALNASGGIDGYKFNQIFIDDQYNPALSEAAARKLIYSDNVLALVSAGATPTVGAVIPLLKQTGTPDVGPFSGSTAIANPLVYQFVQSYANEGAFQARFAIQHLVKNDQLGLLYQNDAVGTPYIPGVKYELKKSPNIRLTSAPFELGGLDFTPQLTQLQQAKDNVVIVESTPQNMPIIFRDAAALRYFPDWVIEDFNGPSAILSKINAKEADSVYLSFSFAIPNSTKLVALQNGLSKYYPQYAVSANTVQGWASASLFAHAFKIMVSTMHLKPTKANLIKALNSVHNYSNNYVSHISWTTNCGCTDHSMADPYDYLAHWQNGVYVQIGRSYVVPRVPGSPGQGPNT